MAFEITQEFPTTFGEGWWNLKERLVSRGFTVKLSSDGTTFGAGDNLDPGGPYAGSFDNANAYMVLVAPSVAGVVREYCIQTTSATLDFMRIFVSADGIGFSGGDATNRPTAADEEFVINNGDNLHPTTSGFPTQNTYWIGGADEGYSFLFEVRPLDQRPRGAFWADVLLDPNPLDPDPAVYGADGDGSDVWSNTGALINSAVSVATTSGICAGRALDGTWVVYHGCVPGNSGSAANHQTNNRPPQSDQGWWKMPVQYRRSDEITYTPDGFFGTKGRSRLFSCIPDGSSKETQTIDSSGTQRAVDGIVMPWSPSLPKSWS